MATPISGLTALSNDSTLAVNTTMDPAEMDTHRTNYRSLINSLLLVAADLENNYAGASQPTDKPAGKIWFDSTNTLWKGYKTLAGTPVQFLEATTAYTADLSTGGTATFRLSGVINVNTTQVSKAGATGVLMTYTLPAGTLARDGQFVCVTAFGTKTGVGGSYSLQPRFGGTAIGTHGSGDGSAQTWAMRFWIVRTGAVTQDAGSYKVVNSDAVGATTLVLFSSALGQTLSGALAIDINLNVVNAADTVTQEIMIVEFGNY